MATAAPFLQKYPSDAALRVQVAHMLARRRPFGTGLATPPVTAGPVIVHPPGSGLATPPITAGPTVTRTGPTLWMDIPPGTKTKTPSAPSTTASYLQSLFGTPLTLEQMTAAAQKRAKAETAALVAPYLLSEQRAADRAAAQAQQIADASKAVASSLQPLADQTHQDYQDALTQLRQFAQGFQGQIGTDAQAAADAA